MSDPQTVLHYDDRGSVFEGPCVYKIKGQDKYMAIIEAFDGPGPRYYKSFIADALDGEWKEQAASWENPFAGLNNVKFNSGVTPWTKDISHGEIIREGYDETLTIDPDNLQFLFQGRDPASNGMQYFMLPYKIGLLKSVK
jgi:hypothetical protein